MSVVRRGDGRWRVDVVVKVGGVRQRVRASAKTRDAGLRKEREIRTRLDAGEEAQRRAPRFDEWATDFLDVAVAENKGSEVAAKKRIVNGILVPRFGSLRLDQITSEHFARFVADQIKDGVMPKTVANRVAILRRMLTKAHEWGRIRSVPKVAKVRVARKEMRHLSFEEAEALLASSEPEWRTMVLVGLRTGLRRGELLALKWDDVNLTTGRILVSRSLWEGQENTTKSGKSRLVDLSPEASAALKVHPTRFRRGYVFGDGVNPLTPNGIKRPLWRASERAGQARAGWHLLRHTYASHLAMLGAPLRYIQETLGHANIETTMRYAHLCPSVAANAARLLDSRSGWDPIGTRFGTGTQ